MAATTSDGAVARHHMRAPGRRLLGPVLAMGLLAACAGSGSEARAAEPSETRSYPLHASIDVEVNELPVTASAGLVLPATWTVVDRGTRSLRLREGTTACTYTVDAAVSIEPIDEASGTDAARSVVPTGDGRLLESGRRGSAAWRVVKLRGNGTQVRLDAVRAQPLRYVSSQQGRPTWLVTRIEARSDPGDECHSGTYRAVLGPRLGDALATLRTRS